MVSHAGTQEKTGMEGLGLKSSADSQWKGGDCLSTRREAHDVNR